MYQINMYYYIYLLLLKIISKTRGWNNYFWPSPLTYFKALFWTNTNRVTVPFVVVSSHNGMASEGQIGLYKTTPSGLFNDYCIEAFNELK